MTPEAEKRREYQRNEGGTAEADVAIINDDIEGKMGVWEVWESGDGTRGPSGSRMSKKCWRSDQKRARY
jgi:hypothetical protein